MVAIARPTWAKSLILRRARRRSFLLCITVVASSLVISLSPWKSLARTGRFVEIDFPTRIAAADESPAEGLLGQQSQIGNCGATPVLPQLQTASQFSGANRRAESDFTLVPKIEISVSAAHLWADGERASGDTGAAVSVRAAREGRS